MLLHIEPSNGLAIYDQIARQVKFAVAHGALQSGELIPSVRELAQQLAVNPNTVARAYRDLQSAGVVEPLRGEGLRITRTAVKQCQQERRELLSDRLRSAIMECRRGGLSAGEIRGLFNDAMKDTAESSV